VKLRDIIIGLLISFIIAVMVGAGVLISMDLHTMNCSPVVAAHSGFAKCG
jgi:hypothetical protein